MSEEEEMQRLQRTLREQGLINGAIHRGELLPVGTTVRWGSNPKSVRRTVLGHRWIGKFSTHLSGNIDKPSVAWDDTFWVDPADVTKVY